MAAKKTAAEQGLQQKIYHQSACKRTLHPESRSMESL